jgi:hypothetical protein
LPDVGVIVIAEVIVAVIVDVIVSDIVIVDEEEDEPTKYNCTYNLHSIGKF